MKDLGIDPSWSVDKQTEWLLSTMLFPDSASLRERHFQRTAAIALSEGPSREIQINTRILFALVEDHPPGGWKSLVDTRMRAGRTAGFLLGTLFLLAKDDVNRPGIRKAKAVLDQVMEFRQNKEINEDFLLHNQKRTDARELMGPVSHLWAATEFVRSGVVIRAQSNGIEAVLRLAATIFAFGSRSADQGGSKARMLIDPSAAFEIPAQFLPFGEEEVDLVLDAQILSDMGSYRPNEVRNNNFD